MDGRAGDLDAVLERLLLGVDAGKRRQQRRVDVEHRVGKRLEQLGADQTHEAGEADEADARARAAPAASRAIEIVARRELAMVEHQRFDAGVAGELEPGGIGRFEMTTAMRASSRPSLDRLDQRLQIAAASGDQDAKRGGPRRRRRAGLARS